MVKNTIYMDLALDWIYTLICSFRDLLQFCIAAEYIDDRHKSSLNEHQLLTILYRRATLIYRLVKRLVASCSEDSNHMYNNFKVLK